MRLPDKIRQSTNVDSYTGELFASFDGVGTDLNFKELKELAEDFMEVMARHFTGVSVDYDAEDYAQWYIENNRMDWEK